MLEWEGFALTEFAEFSGMICAAMAYVVVVALSCLCIHALVKGKASSCYSTPKRRFHILHITILLLFSTFSLIQQAYGATMMLFGWFVETSWFETVPAILPFTVCAADGFMIWRCTVLYQGIATKRRIILNTFLSLLGLILFGAGMMYFVRFSSNFFAEAEFISASFGARPNRNLTWQLFVKKTLGMAHTSVYSSIMTMCIESCALIVVVGVAYTVICLNNVPGLEIPLYLLPQICVISPFMIIYRVAHGKDATSMTPALSVGNMIEREIHFVRSSSTGDIGESV